MKVTKKKNNAHQCTICKIGGVWTIDLFLFFVVFITWKRLIMLNHPPASICQNIHQEFYLLGGNKFESLPTYLWYLPTYIGSSLFIARAKWRVYMMCKREKLVNPIVVHTQRSCAWLFCFILALFQLFS